MHYLNTLTRADAAADYAARGWYPIPLAEKRPITNWTSDPPLTTKQLALLFPETDALQPHLNLGIRMGQCSALVALDIDGQAGREFLCDSLPAQAIIKLQQTIQFSTPNGHRLLYTYPDNPQASRSYRHPANPLKELIRILSDGTQTVAPPSEINGKPYTWIQSTWSIAPWPAEIIERLDAEHASVLHHRTPTHPESFVDAKPNMQRATAWLKKCDPAISGQGGHNQTYKIAIRLVRGFALSYHEALSLITEIYNPTCQPPWSEKELEHKLESALADTRPTRNML